MGVIKRKFLFILAVILAAVFSFAFVFALPVYAEEKERSDIERIEDKPYLEDFRELDINIVKTYPSVSSSAKSLRSSFSTYSYLWVYVKPAAISSENEAHRTFTLSNQPNLTDINWGDNTAYYLSFPRLSAIGVKDKKIRGSQR